MGDPDNFPVIIPLGIPLYIPKLRLVHFSLFHPFIDILSHFQSPKMIRQPISHISLIVRRAAKQKAIFQTPGQGFPIGTAANPEIPILLVKRATVPIPPAPASRGCSTLPTTTPTSTSSVAPNNFAPAGTKEQVLVPLEVLEIIMT